MSFNFVHDFKMWIYSSLAETPEINSKIDKIYLSAVQDAKYPFIFINILNVKNISRFQQYIYEMDFEICIFARDKNQAFLYSLADKIINILIIQKTELKDYLIAGIKTQQISFELGKDLITNKLVISCKSLLKKYEKNI